MIYDIVYVDIYIYTHIICIFYMYVQFQTVCQKLCENGQDGDHSCAWRAISGKNCQAFPGGQWSCKIAGNAMKFEVTEQGVLNELGRLPKARTTMMCVFWATWCEVVEDKLVWYSLVLSDFGVIFSP